MLVVVWVVLSSFLARGRDMRIRKDAIVSPAFTTAFGTCLPPELLEPHVCQLNQSPWDAIVVKNSSDNNQTGAELGDYSRYTRKHYDSLAGDSNGASHNMTLMTAHIADDNENATDDISGIETTIKNLVKKRKKIKRKKTRNIAVHNDEADKVAKKKRKRNSPSAANKRQRKSEKVRYCQKNDGKGWQCKKEAKQGYNFCEHHLSQFRSYSTTHHTNPNPAAASATDTPAPPDTAARRTRGRKTGAFSKPGEFYYYSGFGPRWGRNRGGAEPEGVVEGGSERSSPEVSSASTEEGDATGMVAGFVEEEDDDDDEEEEEGKNRIRRPVKARSLKSLM